MNHRWLFCFTEFSNRVHNHAVIFATLRCSRGCHEKRLLDHLGWVKPGAKRCPWGTQQGKLHILRLLLVCDNGLFVQESFSRNIKFSNVSVVNLSCPSPLKRWCMIFLRIFPILSVLLERTFIIQYVTNVYSFRSESLKECVVLEWFEFLPKR